ncbi:MAG: extensin family protein [Lentilitoribacter sp.]
MLMSLQRLESVRTIFNPKRLVVLSVTLSALLSGVWPHKLFAEDIEPSDGVPIPAETLKYDQLVDKEPAKPFEGAKNKPPFDLELAKICEQKLETRRISFKVKTKITDEKGCIVERPIVINQLSGGISLSREMTLRCEVVIAMDDWVKNIIRPSAKLYLNQDVKSLKISTSYHCRTRNNKPGGKISEHGFANGVDITGFELEDDTVINVSSDVDKINNEALRNAKFHAAARAGACAYFTTVLGPGTNITHQDHFHFDLAYRKSGYRLCQ